MTEKEGLWPITEDLLLRFAHHFDKTFYYAMTEGQMTEKELAKLKKLYSGTHDPSLKNYWAVVTGREMIGVIEGLLRKVESQRKEIQFNKTGGWETK